MALQRESDPGYLGGVAEQMGLVPSLSRRSFLQYTALSAGMLALARLRVPSAAVAAPIGGLRILTPHEAEILSAIVERMVFSGDNAMPSVAQTRAIETIDQALQQLDAPVQSQLRWLLVVIQWGPPFLHLQFSTFLGMSPTERDDYLRSWAASPYEIRRLAFRALKNLSMLGYYSQDATWKGIHYDGPWVPRPRRILITES